VYDQVNSISEANLVHSSCCWLLRSCGDGINFAHQCEDGCFYHLVYSKKAVSKFLNFIHAIGAGCHELHDILIV
jgi:hypothetical protein